MIKAVLFDLDGTLLPMDEEAFTKGYFGLLYRNAEPYGYEEVLDKNGLKLDEIVYFGNSEIEDGRPAKELGIKVYMVGDDIVCDDENPNQFQQIKFEDIKKVI